MNWEPREQGFRRLLTAQGYADNKDISQAADYVKQVDGVRIFAALAYKRLLLFVPHFASGKQFNFYVPDEDAFTPEVLPNIEKRLLAEYQQA